jgi:hypothetical protein
MLYGLVAEPVSHPAVLTRASRVLSTSPGGPPVGEARRRLKEGAPLIVGLSRADTEAVQGRLVDVGLVARIGPAPEGTAPVSQPPGTLFGRRESAVAGLLLAGSLAWLVLTPGGRRVPSPPPPRPPTFALSVFLHSASDGRLYLQGSAQARSTGPSPTGDLEIVIRTERDGGHILTTQVPEATAKSWMEAAATTRNVTFKLPVARWRFAGQHDVEVEGRWGRWRSDPQMVAVP